MNRKALCSLAAAFLLLWPWSLGAQVITPSLDPTEASASPAATGWRMAGALGGKYFESSGARDYNGEQIAEFSGSGSDVNLSYVGESWAAEAGGYGAAYKSKYDLLQGELLRAESGGGLSFAMKGEDFVSMGIGGRNREVKLYLSEDYPDETFQDNSLIGSVSLKLGSFFYVGVGAEKITRQADHFVNNSWTQSTGGLAIQAGERSGTLFRLEGSVTLAPRTSKEAELDQNTGEVHKMASIHQEESLSRASAELQFSGLLFAFKSTTRSTRVDLIHPVTLVPVDRRLEKYEQAGVVWVPKAGMFLGFYFGNQSVSEVYEDKNSLFAVKLGYLMEN